jgi:hypothetical protein
MKQSTTASSERRTRLLAISAFRQWLRCGKVCVPQCPPTESAS